MVERLVRNAKRPFSGQIAWSCTTLQVAHLQINTTSPAAASHGTNKRDFLLSGDKKGDKAWAFSPPVRGPTSCLTARILNPTAGPSEHALTRGDRCLATPASEENANTGILSACTAGAADSCGTALDRRTGSARDPHRGVHRRRHRRHPPHFSSALYRSHMELPYNIITI